MDGLLAVLPQQQVGLHRQSLVEKAGTWMQASNSRVSSRIREYQQQFFLMLKGNDEKCVASIEENIDSKSVQSLQKEISDDSKVEDLKINAKKEDLPSVSEASNSRAENIATLSGDELSEAYGHFQNTMQEVLSETDDLIAGRMKPAELEDLRLRGDLR